MSIHDKFKAATMDETQRGDPWNNHYFALEIDGDEVAHFRECTGFKSTAEIFMIQEGGYNVDSRKRPGQSKWATVTLKFGVNGSTQLMEWRDSYIQDGFIGTDKRKNCSGAIVIKALDGTELRRYSMTQLWPVSWEGPALNSTSSAIAVESIEIAFHEVMIGPITQTPVVVVPDPVPETPAPEPIQFDFDKSNVKKSEEKKVDDASKIYKDAPAIWVEGHTCDLGSASYNLTLSKSRAASTARSMESKDAANGIKRAAYNSAGYGFQYPVAENNSEANRAKNRRCQIWDTPRSGMRPGERPYKSYK
jgi:phage tail-like protein